MYVGVCIDLSVGPKRACILPGLLGAEERLQTQESGDCLGAEEGRVPQAGESAKESEMIQIKKKKKGGGNSRGLK